MFTEGRGFAELEFDGPPDALVPPDFVTDVDQKQDAAIRKGLAGYDGGAKRTSRGRREKEQPESTPFSAILGDLIVRPVRQDRGPRLVAFHSGEQLYLCDETMAAPANDDAFCRFKIRRPRRVALPTPVGANQHQPISVGHVLDRGRPGKTCFAA
jgi:hypothetical protein